jgi:BirA family biotin operon repressor/biotin-[acetyl-CoA-carboxylase] ligase
MIRSGKREAVRQMRFVGSSVGSHQPGKELLERDRILSGLTAKGRSLLRELQIHEQIDSTNAEAMRCIQAGVDSGLAISAEQQLSGRGRRGRHWVSPHASNIYLSLVWEFERGAGGLAGMSLAVGVAVAEALEICGVPAAELKWPNDLLFEGAKFGGILIETAGNGSGGCMAVIGIGLNWAMARSEAGSIDQAWTDITSICTSTGRECAVPGRNTLLAALLDRLLVLLPDFDRRGFGPWRQPWLARNAFAEAQVVVSSGEHRLAGRLAGIDERGALLLDVGGVVQAIDGGEVSLRCSA